MADYGQALPDSKIRKELIRRIIFHQANLLSVGTKVVETVELDTLGVKFDYPSEMTATYPVGDTAVAKRETIKWSEFKADLEKAQVHYMITDSAKLRNLSGTQQSIMARRAGEALATSKDNEILGVLHGGAGSSVAASGLWSSVSTDIEADIIKAWNSILTESNVRTEELQRLGVTLIVPVAAFANLNKLTLIGNVQQTISTYLKTAYGVNILPTRTAELGTSSSTDALMFVPGGMTAQHAVLGARAAAAAGVPLVERERITGSGDDYLITQWYKTVVIEDGSASGQTDRIVKITNVTS